MQIKWNRSCNLEQMPRISKEEFLECFDETLTRIDHEKIGFVITQDDADDMVLCPAEWFLDPFGEGYEELVLIAAEYAIGHGDSEAIPMYINNNLFALSGRTGAVLLEIIERHSNLSTGWESLSKNLSEYISALNNDIGDRRYDDLCNV